MNNKMISAALVGFTLLLGSNAIQAKDYEVTITNNMSEELLAPILVTPIKNDGKIFSGSYVSPEAETQILTGSPEKLVKIIGETKTIVAHGTDGPPGVLLAPGKSITFKTSTDMTAVRFFSMVAPTMVPDNYVSGIVNLSTPTTITLDRYDIGHNEGRKRIVHVSGNAVTVTVK